MKKIKIMVVDDDSSKKGALPAALTDSPDLVLMDLNLESTWMDGVETARAIRIETNARIIILTSFDQPEIILDACRRAFASGYVLKNQFSMLIPTIRTTYSGITPQALLICSLILEVLSPAERAVLDQMLGREITLHSKNKTIANQQSNILRKLELSGKLELCHIFSAYYTSLPRENENSGTLPH